MQAYVFPGQGAQFEGMGGDLYEQSSVAREYFDRADALLDFPISDLMLNGSAEELKPTRIAQPAIFLHSIVTLRVRRPGAEVDVVAGHSLGEITALVAAGALSFESGLRLLQRRAGAMQRACEATQGAMAAVVNFDDAITEQVCAEIDELVVPANYNSRGQLVISGTTAGIDRATERLRELGARMVVPLPVGGGFHSPLMQSAREEFGAAIEDIVFSAPRCPVYQNVTARPEVDPTAIRENLVKQLTEPVRWTQTVERMLAEGVSGFVEIGGKGGILTGLIKKIDRKIPVSRL